MMTWIYRGIALLILLITLKDFWEEESPSWKINAGMVLVPLALRVLMIK